MTRYIYKSPVGVFFSWRPQITTCAETTFHYPCKVQVQVQRGNETILHVSWAWILRVRRTPYLSYRFIWPWSLYGRLWISSQGDCVGWFLFCRIGPGRRTIFDSYSAFLCRFVSAIPHTHTHTPLMQSPALGSWFPVTHRPIYDQYESPSRVRTDRIRPSVCGEEITT